MVECYNNQTHNNKMSFAQQLSDHFGLDLEEVKAYLIGESTPKKSSGKAKKSSDDDDLSKMKKADLQKMLDAREIKYRKADKKDVLIGLLNDTEGEEKHTRVKAGKSSKKEAKDKSKKASKSLIEKTLKKKKNVEVEGALRLSPCKAKHKKRKLLVHVKTKVLFAIDNDMAVGVLLGAKKIGPLSADNVSWIEANGRFVDDDALLEEGDGSESDSDSDSESDAKSEESSSSEEKPKKKETKKGKKETKKEKKAKKADSESGSDSESDVGDVYAGSSSSDSDKLDEDESEDESSD